MKKKKEQLSQKEHKKTLEKLYTAASAIKTSNQMEQFLKEILTESEQLMIGRRVWIAQLLLTGHTHDEICAKLEAGPSTVRRVSKWLDEKLPGYADAIAKKPRRSKNRKEWVDPFSFKALRKKFPLHFLLFNIAEELTKNRSVK